MRLINQKKGVDLRSYYTIFIELGMIGALSILILATNIKLVPADDSYAVPVSDQEIVEMKDVVRTQQQKVPPPPRVPVEVPNDQFIEEEVEIFSSELHFDEPLEIQKEIVVEKEAKKEKEEKIFIVVEHMPQLIGGNAGLYERIVYPKKAAEVGIEGLVVVQFIITKEGIPTNLKITRSIGGGCDEEAIRVVKEARFKPGRQRGEPVPVQYSMPVRFTLKMR